MPAQQERPGSGTEPEPATPDTRRGRARLVAWGAAASYLLANYLSLERAPAIWADLNRALGGAGGTAMVVLYASVGALAAGYVGRYGRRTPSRLLATLALVGVVLLMWWLEHGAAEKFHMVQYGALGLLLYRALRVDFDPRGARFYLIGGVLGAFAGLLDEGIQHCLPTRVFTLHDVFVNGTSVFCALAFFGLHPPERARGERPSARPGSS